MASTQIKEHKVGFTNQLLTASRQYIEKIVDKQQHVLKKEKAFRLNLKEP